MPADRHLQTEDLSFAIPLPATLPTEIGLRTPDLEMPAADKPDVSCDQDSADRTSRIRLVAYAKSQRRNFEPGHELEDWLAAEAEQRSGA